MALPTEDAVLPLALAILAAARAVTAQAAIVEGMAARLVDAVAGQDAAPPPPSPARCDHPEDARTDAGSLRAPLRFFCRQCREFVNPAAEPAADLTT